MNEVMRRHDLVEAELMSDLVEIAGEARAEG